MKHTYNSMALATFACALGFGLSGCVNNNDQKYPDLTDAPRNKKRTKEPYTQGATFDENGNFVGRTDVANHGRRDHTNPHFHLATSSNSTGRSR